MNTRCHFCGNKRFRKTETQYIYRHNDQFLIVNNVPCEQCEYCGEQYFEGKVLEQIEEEFHRIYVRGKKPTKELRVPVEQFSSMISAVENETGPHPI